MKYFGTLKIIFPNPSKKKKTLDVLCYLGHPFLYIVVNIHRTRHLILTFLKLLNQYLLNLV